MGDHYKMLYQGQPDDSAPDELYVVQTDFSAIIKDLEVFAFDGGGTDTITVWLVPDGDSPADENVWIPVEQISGGGRIEWSGSKCLDTGYAIVAQSGGGEILNVMISGLEVDETQG